MNIQRIDLVNIGLIVISLVVAMRLPLELFLFSYAILGPIHYFTEINWLNERKYFVKENKSWIWLLVLIGCSIISIPVLKHLGLEVSASSWITWIQSKVGVLLLLALLFSAAMILLRGLYQMLSALLILAVVLFIAMGYLSDTFLLIGAFLPTIIHVYLFTLLFIFYGAIKSKSTSAYLLTLVHALIPLVIMLIPVHYSAYDPSGDTINAFVATNMHQINGRVAQVLGFVEGNNFQMISEIGIRIQIFITFAYTYHYLNWFSKTSVIGWGKSLTAPKALIIVILCALSSGLYFYDFKTGFLVLLFLSYLHVLLEFPLNAMSIKEVVSWAKSKIIAG